jgi:aspartyl-tRNA synthetase
LPKGKPVTQEFRRIPYDEAMRKYGTDKPDLRNPIEMQDVTEHFAGSGFKVFAGMIANDPKVEVWAIPAKTGGSRAFCDRMNSWAQGEGQPGLGYIFWRKEGDNRRRRPDRQEHRPRAHRGDPPADGPGRWRRLLLRRRRSGQVRRVCRRCARARRRGTEPDRRGPLRTRWIVDFPFYEWDEDEKKVEFAHNPFSMPQGGMDALENQDPLTIKAYQYDLVCNGFEIASGSIRNQSAGSDGQGVRDWG